MRTTARALGIVGLLSAALFGCAGDLKNVTAGRVGCLPTEVTITNDDVGFGSRSWTAACRGRTFQCSGARGTGAACTELALGR